MQQFGLINLKHFNGAHELYHRRFKNENYQGINITQLLEHLEKV